ncbi:sugar phosphate isomerase/epimerase family protein [Actinoplanes sp. NPDC051343]|uniref:sugar phosphate isomerase/epimerase family protein n=1 Tax=Actinoplanes sp. NPDC051343 TaxID=3363906 RepID=UPI00379C26CE
MIFGVSTLGCPGLPLIEVGALLRRHRVSAVQLRCASDEPVNVGLSPAARRTAREQLESSGLTLLGLATYVRLSSGADGFDEHLRLALDLGAPALRLMPGDGPVSAAAAALSAVAARASGSGVRLLVETHDAFLRGSELAALLDAAGTSAGAIWDALHPWRAGEAPAETFAALRPWLAEIQIKDVAAPDRRTPLVPGRGSVPCREVLALARAGGFDGPVVLEHEARWYPGAAPIDDAIEGALALTEVYL